MNTVNKSINNFFFLIISNHEPARNNQQGIESQTDHFTEPVGNCPIISIINYWLIVRTNQKTAH